MKNVIIFHGSGETKESVWFPWLTKGLSEKDFHVSLPDLPDGDNPELQKWLPVALDEKYTEETILIGHSAGCALILSVLEKISIKVKQAILVAGYARSLSDKIEPMIQKSYDWNKINNTVDNFVAINSDDDPWGCTDVEGRFIVDSLGKGALIVLKGQGHMGSETFKQPYKEFPFLLKLID